MNLPGRLWAELALVAWADADASVPDPYALPREHADEEHQAEHDRLMVLSRHFAYRAIEHGFTKLGSDYVYGDLPQESFKSCACGQLFEYRSDWEALGLVGEMPGWDDQDRDITLELRNCPCGSTLAVEKRP